MAKLTFNGEEYVVDHAVKGADYVHGYDASGCPVVSIDGVKDFSLIEYDGTYLTPRSCINEGCNTVVYHDGILKTSDGEQIGVVPGSHEVLWEALYEDEVYLYRESVTSYMYCYLDNLHNLCYGGYPEGTVVKFVLNGAEFVSTLKQYNGSYFLGNPNMYDSSLPDSGEIFILQPFNSSVMLRIKSGLSERTPHEISFSVREDVYEIDPKYLPSMKPYVIDSEAYTYGDDALAAILEGRQILVKVPNKNTTNTLYSNFMPVLQYQLPNDNNDYLILFYLKDGIAENLLTALQAAMQGDTSAFDGVYGVIEMMLSQSYAECPLKVSPIK